MAFTKLTALFFISKVRLPVRNYPPVSSDVNKDIKVQFTPNKQGYLINYLVNCACMKVANIIQEISTFIQKKDPPYGFT